MLSNLTLFKEYSREEVHDIFSPETKYVKSTGTWGLQGIIKIDKNNKDYVFFVTYGQSQSGHEFKEGIDEFGILNWQSQPQQDFKSDIINDLINHDENINNIYLFLRNNKKEKYKYMGLLKYIEHDQNLIKPVYFKWQLLNFDKSEITNIGILPKPITKKDPNIPSNKLVLTEKPINVKVSSQKEQLLKAGFVNFEDLYDKNSELGELGENLVIEYEKEQLIKDNRSDLANLVEATRYTIGNNAKYDVKSYFPDGRVKYIEVKTTKAGLNNPFYISEGEVRFSEKYKENYFIYRVYEYDFEKNNGKIFIIEGSVDREKLSSTNYYYKY